MRRVWILPIFIFLIATAAVAWYLCVAGVMASTFGRPILPNRALFRG